MSSTFFYICSIYFLLLIFTFWLILHWILLIFLSNVLQFVVYRLCTYFVKFLPKYIMFYDATPKDIKFPFSVSSYRLWVYRNMIAFVAFDLVSCDPDKVSHFFLKHFFGSFGVFLFRKLCYFWKEYFLFFFEHFSFSYLHSLLELLIQC